MPNTAIAQFQFGSFVLNIHFTFKL